MGEHRALGVAGGPGCVDQAGDGFRINRGARGGLVGPFREQDCHRERGARWIVAFKQEDLLQGRRILACLEDFGELLGILDKHCLGPAVVDDVRNLGRRQRRVDSDSRDSEGRVGEVRDDPVGLVFRNNGDTVARHKAACGQCGRHRVYAVGKRLPCEGLPLLALFPEKSLAGWISGDRLAEECGGGFGGRKNNRVRRHRCGVLEKGNKVSAFYPAPRNARRIRFRD